jgi:hypothetical protein
MRSSGAGFDYPKTNLATLIPLTAAAARSERDRDHADRAEPVLLRGSLSSFFAGGEPARGWTRIYWSYGPVAGAPTRRQRLCGSSRRVVGHCYRARRLVGVIKPDICSSVGGAEPRRKVQLSPGLRASCHLRR